MAVSNKGLVLLTVPTCVQVVPASVLKNSVPLAVLVPVMAMPLTAPVSASLMPPTRVLTRLPTTPTGVAASSLRPVRVSTVSVNTGASLVPVRVTVMVCSVPSALTAVKLSVYWTLATNWSWALLMVYVHAPSVASVKVP